MFNKANTLTLSILYLGLLPVSVSLLFGIDNVFKGRLPIVLTTWVFPNATQAAWSSLEQGSDAVDAVVAGCSECENKQCQHSVGPGGSPDESGETTLDSMIMDGQTMDVGAVGCLRRVKSAIAVARAVMKYTKHTLMVGELATNFALSMGFTEMNLSTPYSIHLWQKWKSNRCQPNYRENMIPASDCGPYSRLSKCKSYKVIRTEVEPEKEQSSKDNHDTIGMIAIDSSGNISAGTSTNGLNHKIPGRVGDSPITGAGAYADNEAGASVATGDGDIMMRFLPTYGFHAVLQMRLGHDPTTALHTALAPIIKHYPDFHGAMLAVDKNGNYGAACHGYTSWTFCIVNPQTGGVIQKNICQQMVPPQPKVCLRQYPH